VGFRAWGSDLVDLLEAAARAMFSFEYDLDVVPQVESTEISARGDDLESLMYAWLSELLWQHDAQAFVFADIWADALEAQPGDLRVHAVASGSLLGDWFVQTGPQVKAPTMHGLTVTPRDGGYEATVYLDV